MLHYFVATWPSFLKLSIVKMGAKIESQNEKMTFGDVLNPTKLSMESLFSF